jgi:hypothetical protein
MIIKLLLVEKKFLHAKDTISELHAYVASSIDIGKVTN